MISGLLTLILIAATPTCDAAADLEELIAALAPQSGQAKLYFTERRDSPLLEEPLTVTGRLWRNKQGQLVRETVEPHQETQTLSASMVIIERPGRSPRNFSLGHAPELAVLYNALTALLAGDADALRKTFEHELVHDQSRWRLELRPRDDALAERVESLALEGEDGDLQHFVLTLTDGESVTTELSRQP